jgi:FdrA protein
MQVSRDALAVEGVADAQVAMATDLNLRLIADAGFDPPAAGPDDLVVAVRASDERSLDAAFTRIEAALTRPAAGAAGGFLAPPVPRTMRTAARAGANLALISVPGRHAFVEAMEALRAGLHVMVFSDNVPVAQEIALKEEAERRGLLVMGPDCGTAIVGGAGLGFANAVDPGPVGIVGASGTGIQQLCCLLDDAGVGVRHALGTGANDPSAGVGGRSTLRALELLDADPAVEVIALVSKPPAPAVAERLHAATEKMSKPAVTALLGEPGVTLEAAAAEVVRLLGKEPVPHASWPAAGRVRPTGRLLGLFSGGTLREEAGSVVLPVLGPAAMSLDAPGHTLVDLGADEFTRGRAHPMIDPRLRLQHLEEAAADPTVGVVLLDVVLGYGAHPDPAADLAPSIEHVVEQGAAVVVSLCGARRDPQGRDRQAEALKRAGASVYASNAAAARRAAALAQEGES